MADEIDETEFFQHDFTTASEWETFTARLEEQFHEWKLPFVVPGPPLEADQLALCEWVVSEEKFQFQEFTLKLERYCCQIPAVEDQQPVETQPDGVHASVEKTAQSTRMCQAFEDMLSMKNNHCILDEKVESPVHPLTRWYGLRDFVVLSSTAKKAIDSSDIRLLLSSLTIAVAESRSEVPAFVQALEGRQHVYTGVCESRGFQLNYDIVHLRNAPVIYKHLDGLLDMFKGKIGVRYIDPVQTSTRFAFSLEKLLSGTATMQAELDFEDIDNDPVEKLFKLTPFRVSIDPLTELVLYCCWPQVDEQFFIDSQFVSDFVACNAPVWSIRARFDARSICHMSECLSEYLQLHGDPRTLSDLLGSGFNMLGDEAELNPFDALTESKVSSMLASFVSGKADASSSSGVSTKKKTLKLDGPLNDEQLMQMLYYMFPDADEHSTRPYVIPANDVVDPLRIKSANPDSLVHRMSALLALCNSYFGGQRAVAQLWAEFTQEMRFRVSRCIQIPGVATGFPDSRTSLLHQKLQMLNICMERRRIREGGLPFVMSASRGSGSSCQEESEDEFYDCPEDEEEDKTKHALWNRPEGRLSRLGDMRLVDSDEPLYIPVTQEPVPKTEDQLEDDAELMLKMGPESELRIQMMSASLLSDMASFKAANQNGKIEDFIRWYSPRDWVETDNPTDPNRPKGALSSRMLIPGNTWQQVWETAKAVPARRQKRLFDDTKEAEKIMHFFESQSIGRIVQMTLVSLVHSSIVSIKDKNEKEPVTLSNFTELYEKLVSTCCRLSRESWTESTTNPRNNSSKRWEALLAEINNLELLAAKSKCVIDKLFDGASKSQLSEDDATVVRKLLIGHEAIIPGGPESEFAKRINAMFTERSLNEDKHIIEEKIVFPDPIEKQYTLRLSGNDWFKGRCGPQFMRAIMTPNEFRLCGAFSQPLNFS